MTADAFEAFVRSYQDMVYGIAARLLGNPGEAEDVAQTVFLRALQRFDEIGSSPAAAGWLRTVTRNLCLNHLSRYRSRWRLFSELGEAGGEPAFEDAIASASSPARDIERKDEHELLERAIRTLPDHQRVPLVLHYFEELPHQTIAGLLGISLAKVKTDIHRGREALKRRLADAHAAR